MALQTIKPTRFFFHHPNHIDIARKLSAIFSKPPNLRNDTELRDLGTKLNPQTVEIVLEDLRSWRTAYEFFSWAAQQIGFTHNCYTFNSMASILSRSRQVTPLKTLALDIVNCRCTMTPGALGFLIRCLGSQGLADEANRLFDRAKEMNCFPNSYTYNCLLEALAKSGRVDLVEKRFKEMADSGRELDKFTLTPVLQAYCNAGNFREALGIFDRIHSYGWVDEHVFTILVVSFSKSGDIDKACEIINMMGALKMTLNEKTFHVLIHGFMGEGRVDKALVLFDKMRESGFMGDLPLYRVLIDGLCEKKEFGKALDLYSEMKDSGIPFDVSVTAKLISSFCQEGDVVMEKILVEEIEEMADTNSLVLLYNAVLDGFVKKGEVDKALSLVRGMVESPKLAECSDTTSDTDIGNGISLSTFKKVVFPNANSFNIVIDGLCKTHRLDMALELFNEMIQVGCTGNVLIYNNLIHELCNADRLEESYVLLRAMKESRFNPTQFTHNTIFGCLCKRKNVSDALDLMKEMRHHGHEPWIKHCTMLVKQLCAHGKVLDACDFLNEMAQVGFLPSMIPYSAAIDGLCKMRKVDQAMKLFRDISMDGYSPDVVAHNILINGLCKAGKVSEAQDIMNEMLEKGLVPSVVTYNSLIDGWCKADRVDLALLCFSKMTDEARPPTIITYTTLIDGLCNAGRPDDAFVLWKEMRDKECAPNKIAYTALVNGLCKCSRADDALVYFNEMKAKELEPDTFIYVALINAFVSERNLVLVFKLLKEMSQKANFPSSRDKNYLLLVDAVNKLYKDESISLDVKNLIEEGHFPMFCTSVHGIEENIDES